MQCGAEDLVFEPKAGNDETRDVLAGKRIDKGGIEPRTLVFLEQELALLGVRHCARARQRLWFASPRDRENRYADNAGGLGDDGSPLLMPGRQPGETRQEIVR